MYPTNCLILNQKNKFSRFHAIFEYYGPQTLTSKSKTLGICNDTSGLNDPQNRKSKYSKLYIHAVFGFNIAR